MAYIAATSTPATTAAAGTVLLDRVPGSIPGSLWQAAMPGTIGDSGLGANANYGNEFFVDSAATAPSVSFYKASNDTGTHIGALYNKATGVLLASVTFTGETASGWQTQSFTSPVDLAAATHYIVVLHTQSTHFSYSSTGSVTPSSGLHLVGDTHFDNNTGLDLPTAIISSGNTWAVDIAVFLSGTAKAVQTRFMPTTKTANYTLNANDSIVIAGANSLTFTLPAANSVPAGLDYVVKNDNFTGTTIARSGSDTIDGSTTYSLVAAYSSVMLVGDGIATWRVI